MTSLGTHPRRKPSVRDANQSNIDLAAPYTDVLKQQRLEDPFFKSVQNNTSHSHHPGTMITRRLASTVSVPPETKSPRKIVLVGAGFLGKSSL